MDEPTAAEPTAALIAYRWFQVRDDGTLAGAQNVVWPPGVGLHAEHVPTSVLTERTEGPTPLLSVVWAALRPVERAVASVVAGGAVIAGAGLAGRWAALAVAVSVTALAWQVRRRHRDLGDVLLRICAVLLGLFTAALLGAAGWMLVLVAASVNDRISGHLSGALDSAGIAAALATSAVFAVMASAMVALFRIYIHPIRAPRHLCPAPPRRLVARWVPECGIHGYRSLKLAVEGASRGWTLQRPLVIAQVSLWGRVFPYSDGYRAEWGRIDALYDDGTGHVEVPAARYGIPAIPVPLALVDRNPPRRGAAATAAGTTMRAWAERRAAR